jgi:predicted benzoate:H+ symporter BenE
MLSLSHASIQDADFQRTLTHSTGATYLLWAPLGSHYSTIIASETRAVALMALGLQTLRLAVPCRTVEPEFVTPIEHFQLSLCYTILRPCLLLPQIKQSMDSEGISRQLRQMKLRNPHLHLSKLAITFGSGDKKTRLKLCDVRGLILHIFDRLLFCYKNPPS